MTRAAVASACLRSCLPDRFPVVDMHVATIEPGAVRGNHYHAERREVLVIMAADRWSLHWDEGADTPARQREFTDPGAVLVTVPPGMSHAIRNDGAVPMQIVRVGRRPLRRDEA